MNWEGLLTSKHISRRLKAMYFKEPTSFWLGIRSMDREPSVRDKIVEELKGVTTSFAPIHVEKSEKVLYMEVLGKKAAPVVGNNLNAQEVVKMTKVLDRELGSK